MKAKILIELEMPYDRTRYPPLINLAENEFYSKKEKKYKWVFRLEILPQVIAVLNKEVEFDEIDVNKIISRCPVISQEIEKGIYKGKGFIDVIAMPNLFIVTHIVNKKIQKSKIPIETVEALWKVIQRQPMNKPIKTRTVAKNYCDELKITRFNKPLFDWSKMFGTRNFYIPFNLSIKILENYGVVNYYKDGRIEKITDSWVLQSVLLKSETTIISEDI